MQLIIWLIVLVLIFLGLAYYFTIWFKPQIFGYFPDSIKTDKKVIALTFDDGPNPPDTENLLRILDKHQVRATFFMPAKNLERFPDLARKIIAAGHIVGNHSYAHKFFNHFKTLTFEKEISRAQAVIQQITGKTPALYRSPWLFKQPWLLTNLRKHKLTPVSGFFSSNWEVWHASAELIFQDAMRVVAPGRIIIFHDGFDTKGGRREGSVGAIDLLIPELKKQGYEFLTADEILGVPAYQNL
ncbi:MAG: polysaccharide deacetylase family protein [Candidatus Falkowbacteria bacterium]|nr:polysaccharide deacetylase family protein [Candidatus Falkowbacteria bacterium]